MTITPKTLSLDFTKSQYRALIQCVCLGNWVANAYAESAAEEKTSLDQIEEYILARAGHIGLGDLVDSGGAPARGRRAFPSAELDDLIQPLIDRYDDDTFWQELADRLAERDLRREGRTLSVSDASARLAELDAAAERYFAEFEVHGLDRVEVRG